MPAGCAAQSLEQLKKYGVFSKVDIADQADALRQYVVKGELAESWIASQFGGLPDVPLGTLQNSAGVVIRQDLSPDLFILVLSARAAQEFDSWIEAQALPVYSTDTYEALAIL